MFITERKVIPAYTVPAQEVPERIIEDSAVCIQCDWCGAMSPKTYGWDTDEYIALCQNVSMVENKKLPDGDSIETIIQADFCPNCFKNRLVPLMQGAGVAVRTTVE
jgi:hypothetical protein